MEATRNIWWLFALGVLFTLTACAKEENLPPLSGNDDQEQNPENMTPEQQEVVAYLDRWNKAMIDRDVETLGSLMADDLILVHITGATQTKQEWLDEIAAETMRYYAIERQNLNILIDGNHATVTYLSIIDARIWGSRGTWRINSTAHLVKTENGWIRTDPERSEDN